jgi:hypothetical protein
MEATNVVAKDLDTAFWFDVAAHKRKVSPKEAQLHIPPKLWKALKKCINEYGDSSDFSSLVFSYGEITYWNDRYITRQDGEGTLGAVDDQMDGYNCLQTWSENRDELYYLCGDDGPISGPWMLYNY